MAFMVRDAESSVVEPHRIYDELSNADNPISNQLFV